MIHTTWYFIATLATITAAASGFIAYWRGYNTARNETATIIRQLVEDCDDLARTCDMLEDELTNRKQVALTAADKAMFRAIIDRQTGDINEWRRNGH